MAENCPWLDFAAYYFINHLCRIYLSGKTSLLCQYHQELSLQINNIISSHTPARLKIIVAVASIIIIVE